MLPQKSEQSKLVIFYILQSISYILSLNITSQPGPGAAREKFDELTSFGVWGTLGSGGRVGAVMLVLRNIPGLVGRSVQNLVEIGPAVWA